MGDLFDGGHQQRLDRGFLFCGEWSKAFALAFKLGARGLRSICEAIINDAMFELPSDKTSEKLSINRAYAEEKFSKSQYSKLKVA